MFLFRKKKTSEATAGKAPAASSASSGLPPKPKTAEAAKREALQNKPKEEEAEIERAKTVEDEEGHRKKASRRISQTQFGKPLSYNAYITQTKSEQKANE